MAKTKTVYICQLCGYSHPKWQGMCSGCGEYTELLEQIEEPAKQSSAKHSLSSGKPLFNMPTTINNISDEVITKADSGIPEFNTVAGGGIVAGSMILIGGDPGIGKSTLLTQILYNLSNSHKVLYVSAEESCSQVKIRCNRLGTTNNALSIINETEMEAIEQILVDGDYKFVVIDSIQAVYLSSLNSSPGSVSQVRECASHLMRIAKSKNITIFIIGHVTKDGNIAGPKVLEHIMDTVLYFEGESLSTFKILRAVKNRFGPTNEVGIFEMTDIGVKGIKNPSQILLSEDRGINAGSVVTAAIEGTRCILVELQALVCQTVFGMPRRMSNGIDYNKLVLLLAVLEKRGGVKLFDQDVYVNVMSGLKILEPSVDLAVILAIYSALKNIPLKKDTAVFGEVGLTGEIRNISGICKRVSECINLGFRKIIIPQSGLKQIDTKYKNQAEIIGVKYIADALVELKRVN